MNINEYNQLEHIKSLEKDILELCRSIGAILERPMIELDINSENQEVRDIKIYRKRLDI